MGSAPMRAKASLNAETPMVIGTATIMGRKQNASIRKHILSTLDMKRPWVSRLDILGPGMNVGQDLRKGQPEWSHGVRPLWLKSVLGWEVFETAAICRTRPNKALDPWGR